MKINKIILGVIISLVITYFLLSKISIGDILNTVKSIKISYIVFGFMIYVIIIAGRSIRFQKISKLSSFRDTFSIVCIHNFFNNILPFKSGELSYPVMVKRKFNIPFSKTLSDLAIIRFFDLIWTGFILNLAILFSYSYFKNLLIYSMLNLIIILTLFIFIYYLSKLLKLEKVNSKKSSTNKIFQFILSVLSNLSKRNTKEIVFIAILSLIISFFMFLLAYILIRGLGLDVPVSLVIIGGSLSMLAMFIPLQGPLNLGTTEIGFIFPFVVYGIAKEKAISISFSYHILTLVLALILFLIGITKFNSNKKTNLN